MELAQEISFIARNLDWDFEEDLSQAVGDIAAHRIAGGARAVAHGPRDAALRVAQGATEYWTEESPLIASRVKVEDFVARGLAAARRLERLEKRIDVTGRGPDRNLGRRRQVPSLDSMSDPPALRSASRFRCRAGRIARGDRPDRRPASGAPGARRSRHVGSAAAAARASSRRT
jgi:hypothetical protein